MIRIVIYRRGLFSSRPFKTYQSIPHKSISNLSRMSSDARESDKLSPFNPKASFKYTQNPSPSWNFGEGQSDSDIGAKWKEEEKLGTKTFDPTTLGSLATYRLMISGIIPRPIAFVSSLSSEGIGNLAPFSYFSMISHNPPIVTVSFSLSQRSGKTQNTRDNILNTKEFVVNLISEQFVEAANVCSVDAPEDVDEYLISGLTPVPSTSVKPPRVKESAFSLECELFSYQDIHGTNSEEISTTLVLGRVKMIHARNAILTPDGNLVDPEKACFVSRLGGNTYARIGEGFDIPRPSWKHIKSEVEKLILDKN